MAEEADEPGSRFRSFLAYPLYITPQRWRAKCDYLENVVDFAKIRENMVEMRWGGRPCHYAAIGAGNDGGFVNIRLVRLKKRSIDRIDVQKLKEEILNPKENEFFGDTAHLVVDPARGLAIGEYHPEAVRVLGEMPGKLLNQAFLKASCPDRVAFHPFPTGSFRDAVRGKVISKYTIDLGPASVQALERMGFGADSIRRLIRDDEVVSVRVQLRVRAGPRASMDRLEKIEGLAALIKSDKGRSFRIVTEDYAVYDLIRSNFVRFECVVKLASPGRDDAERRAIFGHLRELLKENRQALLKEIPPAPKAIEDFGESN